MKPLKKLKTHSLLKLPYAAASLFLSLTPMLAADYPSTILGDKPVAYYRFEATSCATTAADSFGNGFNAAYAYDWDTNQVPDYPQLGQPGIAANALLFYTYTNPGPVLHRGFVNLPFRPELSPTTADGQHGAPFSAECWVQPSTQPASFSVPLAMCGNYETNAPYGNASGWNFYQSPGPNSYWILNVKNGPFEQATSVPIQLFQWYHLAVTYDRSTFVFYVNGVVQATSDGWFGYYANHRFDGQVGAGDNTGFLAFNGGADEVAFYTNVLTTAQILSHYQVGTNSFRVALTPPSPLIPPASRTNYAGTWATFTVVANGTAPLKFQWQKNGTPMAGATNSSFSFPCSYPLDNAASLSVTITNAVGSTNSAMATLTVLTNLNIIHGPFGPITRNAGSKAAFRVVADGALPITYQWFAGPVALPGATNDTLWLNNVQPDAATNYHAQVTGPFGQADSGAAALLVQPRPVAVPVTGYARLVVADGPVAYWRLDEASGTNAATDAVGSFDGAYQGNPGALTFSVPAGILNETDPAVHLSTNALVLIPYALELNPVTGPWSAEAWVRPATTNVNNFRTVFSSMHSRDSGAHLFGWSVYQNPQGYWTLDVFNGTGSGSFTNDLFHHPLDPGLWYHMVITDDLSTIRYYVNNLLVVSLDRKGFGFIPNGVNGDASVAGAPAVLGQRSDLVFDGFTGGFDDTAFYNYALSPQQIRNHYLNNVSLVIAQSGHSVVVTWPGVGLTLQTSSDLLNGHFTNVPAATSPYTNAAGAGPVHFRLKMQ